MNRLRYSVSLSYEVMDPMVDFLLNIEATRISRQLVVAERLIFPPSIQATHYSVLCGISRKPPAGRALGGYATGAALGRRLAAV